MIDSDYEDFVSKVAAARKKPFAAIEPIAQGRVWMGDQAKANGLVDELGGIDRAIEIVKQKAGIPAADKVSLVIYPAAPHHRRLSAPARSGFGRRCRALGPGSGPLRPPGATPICVLASRRHASYHAIFVTIK